MAALAGSFALALISVLIGEAATSHILGSTVVVALFGMIVAGVFVLPVLLVSEIAKLNSWIFYTAACAIAAPAIMWVMHSKAMEPILVMLPVVGLCGALSGAVYWSLAWRVFEPNIWSSGDL
uniref:hypothetical protein n=1 Tax=uncultured Altererythrobacter sp. TaxID=500840 RepID=UPI0026027C11|nr:hypothetical protein [uncultured Altererythrobacter sp.]